MYKVVNAVKTLYKILPLCITLTTTHLFTTSMYYSINWVGVVHNICISVFSLGLWITSGAL